MNIARLQIRICASEAKRFAVESSAGERLATRRVEFRRYANTDDLCAVLTLDNKGFELCTIHGRKCFLPDPEWIAVSNSDNRPGYCRVLVSIPDLRYLSAADFRLTKDDDNGDKTPGDQLIISHFNLRRESAKKLEFELELWVHPKSYWLDFMNG